MRGIYICGCGFEGHVFSCDALILPFISVFFFLFVQVFVLFGQAPESAYILAQLGRLCASRGHLLDLIEQLEAESEIEGTVMLVEQGSYFDCPPGVLADVSRC